MSRRTGRIVAIVGTAALGSFGLVAGAGPAGAADPQTFAYTGAVQTYVVPADVCAVTLDAAGANGGDGDFVDGFPPDAFGSDGVEAQFVGGTGGGASATFLVDPGDVITVLVGGVGGPGGGGSQAGGFGGGGDGGDGDEGVGGGGGGGASAFTLDGEPLLVAGGGGGGGAVVQDGGAGGSAGGDGSPGADNGAPSNGRPGGGGTASAGGTGGLPGQPLPGTAGASGSLGQGGAGGDFGGALAGGGGGGGGGWFGGGGGGGAGNGGSGGGGGGGSSFVGASVGPVTTGSSSQDVDGNGSATITPIGPACHVLTVEKQVEGVVPSGTTFVAHAECLTGEATDVQFDEQGAPLGSPQLLVADGAECTVTETETGGAVSTSYACAAAAGDPPVACSTDGRTVAFDSEAAQQATVTITNVFPAAVQVITPRFTG
jgi:hypothetical protein